MRIDLRATPYVRTAHATSRPNLDPNISTKYEARVCVFQHIHAAESNWVKIVLGLLDDIHRCSPAARARKTRVCRTKRGINYRYNESCAGRTQISKPLRAMVLGNHRGNRWGVENLWRPECEQRKESHEWATGFLEQPRVRVDIIG